MTIEREASKYTAEYLLEYLTKFYGGMDGDYGIECQDRRIMTIDGRLATGIRFHASHREPPIGYTRVDDVEYEGATFRCYIKWSENQ